MNHSENGHGWDIYTVLAVCSIKVNLKMPGDARQERKTQVDQRGHGCTNHVRVPTPMRPADWPVAM